MKFKKKPIEIEAYPVTAVIQAVKSDRCNMLPKWVVNALGGSGIITWAFGRNWLEIKTLEGTMRASEGDWLIQGVQGEIYPCKADIFEATYDKIVDT